MPRICRVICELSCEPFIYYKKMNPGKLLTKGFPGFPKWRRWDLKPFDVMKKPLFLALFKIQVSYPESLDKLDRSIL